MATCPNGHTSTATDYCDTCGAPVLAAASADPAVAAETLDAGQPAAVDLGGSQPAPSDAASVNATSKPCPHCHGLNPTGALFCEACGYDFTTGSLPRPSATAPEGAHRPESAPALANPLDLEPTVAQPPVPSAPSAVDAPDADEAPDAADEQPDDGADLGAADEPVAAPEASVEPDATPIPAPAVPAVHEEPATLPDADEAPEPEPVADPQEPVLAPSASGGDAPSEEPTVVQSTVPAPASAGKTDHVAELWIDPDWYAGQDSPDQLPSPGLPRVVGLRGTSWLIGRPSKSRGITPDLDCEPDTGVSRKHAQISFDGARWWVEDLGSSNGTYVGEAGAPLPSSPVKGRTELGVDARVYVGSWTRIVIRPAEEGEADL